MEGTWKEDAEDDSKFLSGFAVTALYQSCDASWEITSQKDWCILLWNMNQEPTHGATSPIAMIYGSGNQEVVAGLTFVIITPNDDLTKFCFPPRQF